MRKIIQKIVPLVLLILVFLLLYKIYIPRINAFGCFDDCFNIMGGYFIKNGNEIFKDFYFNHQPGMAYLSAFVQMISNPTSIAELILRNRQLVFAFSFFFSMLFYLRFGWKMIIPILLYEFSKFYFFGDRFLAESIVGYFLVYQLASLFDFYRTGKIKGIDTYLIPFCCYAVIFLREPYLPVALFLFVSYQVLSFKKHKSKVYLSSGLLITASLATVLLHSPVDYYFNLVTINQGILSSDAFNQNVFVKFLKILLYPYYLLVSPLPWTIYRTFAFFLTLSFTLGMFYSGFVLKKWKIVIFSFILLFLANLRPGPANVLFYEAFNLSVWTYLFITVTILSAYYSFKKSKRVGTVIFITSLISLVTLLSNKGYFAYEKFTTHEEFFINFSYVMDVGTKIRDLSSTGDTIFIDGYDDLILWESKLPSSYRYLWYTSSMPRFQKYKAERDEMFANSPPQFYYGICPDEANPGQDFVSNILRKNYVSISPKKDRGCIMIHKEKLLKITDRQKKTLEGTRYILWD